RVTAGVDERAAEALVDADALGEAERPLVAGVGFPREPVAHRPAIVLRRRQHVAVLEFLAEERVLVAGAQAAVGRWLEDPLVETLRAIDAVQVAEARLVQVA